MYSLHLRDIELLTCTFYNKKMMADRDVPSSRYINDLAVLAVMDTTFVVSSVVVVIYFWRSNLLLFARCIINAPMCTKCGPKASSNQIYIPPSSFRSIVYVHIKRLIYFLSFFRTSSLFFTK